MNRDCSLPSGLSNLGDQVRVIDRDGTNLGFMIVAEAQKLASEQGGELYVLARTQNLTLVQIVLVKKAPAP
jgi:translation initiation factor IF-3